MKPSSYGMSPTYVGLINVVREILLDHLIKYFFLNKKNHVGWFESLGKLLLYCINSCICTGIFKNNHTYTHIHIYIYIYVQITRGVKVTT